MTSVVSLQEVSKEYRLGVLGAGSLRRAFGEALSGLSVSSKDNRFYALQNVTFSLTKGETLGLIGPNGAGKSTTLRIVAGITKPTAGYVQVDGRLASLLELGAGFHPELTGRENIYLYGSILGIKRKEIQSLFDSIVDFSELEKFLDTPLKRYSSGMYVRLAFAVAAQLEPDILLVDEVLAVGDAGFRQKCLARMEQLRQQGTALIFVSHNAHMVASICQRAILLVEGNILLDGSSEQTIKTYEQYLRKRTVDIGGQEKASGGPTGNLVDIIDVTITGDETGQEISHFDYHQSASINVRYHAYDRLIKPILHVRLWRDDGTPCFTVRSNQEGARLDNLVFEGEGTFGLRLAPLQLYGGKYQAEVIIVDSTNVESLAMAYSLHFTVNGPGNMATEIMGIYVPTSEWVLDP